MFSALRNKFPDSDTWIYSSNLFTQALSRLDLQGTFLGTDSLHPGVSILWILSLAQTIQISFLKSLSYFNLFVLFFPFLSIIFIVKCWAKDSKIPLLLFSLVFWLINPNSILLGNITWLDALIAPLYFLITLLWLEALKTDSKINVWWVGVLAGVIVLTKYIGLIMLPTITIISLIYAKQNQIPYETIASKISIVVILSAVIFCLFYPAVIVDPKTTLFSRFQQEIGSQVISINSSLITIPSLLKKLFMLNPIIHIGIFLIVIRLFKRKALNKVEMIATAGLIYQVSLYIIILVLYDQGRGVEAFVTGLNRYVVPGILLLTPFTLDQIYHGKFNRYLKILLFSVLFCWELVYFI